MRFFRFIGACWSSCFYAPCPLHVCALFRIGYALLLLISVGFWLPDLHRWFAADGLFPKGTTEQYYEHGMFSLLDYLPETNAVAYVCYVIFVLQIVGLLVGFWTRFQAICICLWFLSFKNHSPMLWAGEDVVFSIFGMLLVFLPAGEVAAIDAKRGARRPTRSDKQEHPVWPLRLIQIQTCLILFASGLQKLSGEAWRSGTALYYITRLDDTFGRFPLPRFALEWLPAIKMLTWSVIAVELLVPLCIWHPKLRRFALLAAFLLHLGIEYAMDLFLFEWIMMLGWCTFLSNERARRLLDLGASLGRKKRTIACKL